MIMTPQEIIAGNKLIAEFMGLRIDSFPNGLSDSWFVDTNNPFSIYQNMSPNEAKFHSSWDWLMPVVEKIWSLGGWEYCIFANGCTINGDHESPPYISQTEGNTIEATHKAVIQFIQWFNQQKQ